MASAYEAALPLPLSLRARFQAWLLGVLGYVVLAACTACAICLLSWSAADASLFRSASEPTRNLLGPLGAILADLIIYLFGLSGVLLILPPLFWALQLITMGRLDHARTKLVVAPIAIGLFATAAAALPTTGGWPLSYGYGGLLGDQVLKLIGGLLAMLRPERAAATAGLFCFAGGVVLLMKSLGLSQRDLKVVFQRPARRRIGRALRRWDLFAHGRDLSGPRREPTLRMPAIRTAPRSSHHSFAPSFAAQAQRQEPAGNGFGDGFHNMAPQADLSRDETSDIARRFAPARHDVTAPEGTAMDAQASTWPNDETGPEERMAIDGPYRPHRAHQVPDQRSWPSSADPLPHEPAFDDLYGRAVAIVLSDRKTSKEYLQRRLCIGYMRASDLVERMEREGVLGAPLYNGVRPILIDGPGSDEI